MTEKSVSKNDVSEILPTSGTILHRVFKSYLEEMKEHIDNYLNGIYDQEHIFLEFEKTITKLRLASKYGVVKNVITRAEAILLKSIMDDPKFDCEDILSGEDDLDHINTDYDNLENQEEVYLAQIAKNNHQTELIEA